MKDKIARTIIKTVFFKILTTGATALILGSLKGAIMIHIVMTGIYLVYERIWNRIKWGKITEKNTVKNLAVL